MGGFQVAALNEPQEAQVSLERPQEVQNGPRRLKMPTRRSQEVQNEPQETPGGPKCQNIPGGPNEPQEAPGDSK